MSKVTVYANSKFATVLSFLGYLCAPIGVYCLFEDGLDKSVGIIILAVGLALKILSNLVNRWKEKWLAKRREAKKDQNT